MNEIENSFKRLMTRIGSAMLIFFAVITVAGLLTDPARDLIFDSMRDPEASVVYSILYSAFYALPFVGAAVFIFATTEKDSVPAVKKVALPIETPLYIIVAIAVTAALSYLNQYFVAVFDYGKFTEQVLFSNEYGEGYKIALKILTSAIVPAVFEELLFRGAVLSRLRPYGKSVAIIISAVLFGLMHQNAGQFLYATAAGIVLGWIAVQTGSLTCAMLCHFMNNAWSVMQNVIFEKWPPYSAAVAVSVTEALVLLLGLVCASILTVRYYRIREKNDFSRGIFGRSLRFERELPCEIPVSRAARLFWQPTVTLFTVISAVTAVMLLILSMMFSIGGLI